MLHVFLKLSRRLVTFETNAFTASSLFGLGGCVLSVLPSGLAGFLSSALITFKISVATGNNTLLTSCFTFLGSKTSFNNDVKVGSLSKTAILAFPFTHLFKCFVDTLISPISSHLKVETFLSSVLCL